MGIYSNNRIFSLNEDAVISRTEYNIMDFLIEARKTDLEVFETVIGCDFREAYTEAGMLPLNEEVKDNKIKEAVKTIAQKIKSMLHKFVEAMKTLKKKLSIRIGKIKSSIKGLKEGTTQNKYKKLIGTTIESENATYAKNIELTYNIASGDAFKDDLAKLNSSVFHLGEDLKRMSYKSKEEVDSFVSDNKDIKDINNEKETLEKIIDKSKSVYDNSDTSFKYDRNVHYWTCKYRDLDVNYTFDHSIYDQITDYIEKLENDIDKLLKPGDDASLEVTKANAVYQVTSQICSSVGSIVSRCETESESAFSNLFHLALDISRARVKNIENSNNK